MKDTELDDEDAFVKATRAVNKAAKLRHSCSKTGNSDIGGTWR